MNSLKTKYQEAIDLLDGYITSNKDAVKISNLLNDISNTCASNGIIDGIIEGFRVNEFFVSNEENQKLAIELMKELTRSIRKFNLKEGDYIKLKYSETKHFPVKVVSVNDQGIKFRTLHGEEEKNETWIRFGGILEISHGIIEGCGFRRVDEKNIDKGWEFKDKKAQLNISPVGYADYELTTKDEKFHIVDLKDLFHKLKDLIGDPDEIVKKACSQHIRQQ